jgi:hypothetical protein
MHNSVSTGARSLLIKTVACVFPYYPNTPGAAKALQTDISITLYFPYH